MTGLLTEEFYVLFGDALGWLRKNIKVITAQRDKHHFHSNELKHIGQNIRMNDLKLRYSVRHIDPSSDYLVQTGFPHTFPTD